MNTINRRPWAALVVAATAFVCGVASAHGPMPQRVTQTVEIDVSPDAVWKRIGDFGDLSWHPSVAKTKADHGNDAGSIRTIELRDGAQIVELLKSRSESERSLTYEIVEPGPIPVSVYSATLSVKSGAGQASVVEWTAGFMRADRSPRPEAGKTDADAVAAVTAVFRAGLDAINTNAGKP